MNTQDLVTKAKAGTLTAEEIDAAARSLQSPDCIGEPYDLLYVLGEGYAL